MLHQGAALLGLGRHTEAIPVLEEAQRIAKAAGTGAVEGRACNALVEAHLQSRDGVEPARYPTPTPVFV
jgi:hypothetical protein